MYDGFYIEWRYSTERKLPSVLYSKDIRVLHKESGGERRLMVLLGDAYLIQFSLHHTSPESKRLKRYSVILSNYREYKTKTEFVKIYFTNFTSLYSILCFLPFLLTDNILIPGRP